MDKKIGKKQEEYLETAKKILPFLGQMQDKIISKNEELFPNEMQLLAGYGELLSGSLPLFGYAQHMDINELVNEISMGSISGERLVQLLDQLIKVTQFLIGKGGGKQKRCRCCGEKVYYWPLSDYYVQQGDKYHAKRHIWQMLNKKEYMCPCCNSSDRDRLIVSFLEWLELENATGEESVLHIAPAGSISHWIYENCPGITYHTTDLYMKGVTFQIDIQNMKGIQDESYDYIICSHVLEHVQDDRKAMRELHRILKKSGMVLFLVPVALDIEHIDEEWGLTEEENWQRFEQGDHCRIYAQQELVERLEESGFCVRQLGKDFFGEAAFKENSVEDSGILYVLTKTDDPLEKMLDDIRKKRTSELREQPLVSVIMPAYNHEEYVVEAIESVLNQTYKNVEFLVADDGSSDGTAEEILKYEDRIDQIHLFDVNTGAVEAFVTLVENAKGKYIAVMHSDDVWDLNKLDMQVKYMINHPEVEACFTGCKFIDSAGAKTEAPLFAVDNKSKEEWFLYVYEHGNTFGHPSLMIKRERYRELLNNNAVKMFRQLPDYWMWLQLLQKSEIHILEKDLTYFRTHEEGNKRNTSAAVPENFHRHMIEEGYIWYSVFKNMSEDFFVKVFESFLIKKENLTSELILCEKFFVLLRTKGEHRRHAAIFFLFDLYQIPGMDKILEEQYEFTNLDIYKITGERLYA